MSLGVMSIGIPATDLSLACIIRPRLQHTAHAGVLTTTTLGFQFSWEIYHLSLHLDCISIFSVGAWRHHWIHLMTCRLIDHHRDDFHIPLRPQHTTFPFSFTNVSRASVHVASLAHQKRLHPEANRRLNSQSLARHPKKYYSTTKTHRPETAANNNSFAFVYSTSETISAPSTKKNHHHDYRSSLVSAAEPTTAFSK